MAPRHTRTPSRAPKAISGPIQRVVIIVKENHTFDNYFGRFPGADGDPSLPLASDPPSSDHPHDHSSWLKRARIATREQYAETNIPHYWAYARQYTSPIINNPHYRDPVNMQPPFDLPSLPANLDAAGYTWRNYGGYMFPMITALRKSGNNLQSAQFATDAPAGKLPTVSWVYGPQGLSEHPVESVKDGEAWTVAQVDAIVTGGLWPTTATFITWDVWGGWYDQVTPPNVEKWTDGTEFRYGSRVGCLVLSPYAKAGYISKSQHSHVSVVKYCETLLGLKPINARDKAADDLSDCFDLTQKPLPPPQPPA